MKSGVTISPIELFFLGNCMHAKYIDYAYIAAMPDIQKRYALHEQQALERLEEKGILEEDFSGNVEIDEDMELLFKPVFFGETESRIDNGRSYRIHIMDESMTMSILEDDQITFQETTEEELRKLLTGNVTVQCSRVREGFCEETFTARQMKKSEHIEWAIKILKGDI